MSGSAARRDGPRRRGRALARAAIAAGVCAGLLAGAAAAQTSLGGQRVGTSSGSFLKIPIDARGTALAGAAAAITTGPAAMFINPAGLGIEGERALLLSGIDYLVDIPAGGAAIAFPFAPLRGALGFSVVGLYTEMDETDEYHPLGTGRRFSYGVGCLGAAASRALTDKLNFGASLRAYREELAPELGGPALTTWLADAGAIYFVGYRDARIGIALNNFGPDLSPAGDFVSRRDGTEIRYSSFSPPTLFRLGFSIDPWRSGSWATLVAAEIGHVADNQEAFRAGAEVSYARALALRGGYDFAADALKLHAGVGLRANVAGRAWAFDYAYSDAGDLGAVQRWTLTVPW